VSARLLAAAAVAALAVGCAAEVSDAPMGALDDDTGFEVSADDDVNVREDDSEEAASSAATVGPNNCDCECNVRIEGNLVPRHVIERHVGRSDNELARAYVYQSRRPFLPESSWTQAMHARRAIVAVIEQNCARIRNFRNSALPVGTDRVFTTDVTPVPGRICFTRSVPNPTQIPHVAHVRCGRGNGARLIMTKTASGGIRVKTAYPEGPISRVNVRYVTCDRAGDNGICPS
jgi:hypothetical protein